MSCELTANSTIQSGMKLQFFFPLIDQSHLRLKVKKITEKQLEIWSDRCCLKCTCHVIEMHSHSHSAAIY